jgi:hypothetical protein
MLARARVPPHEIQDRSAAGFESSAPTRRGSHAREELSVNSEKDGAKDVHGTDRSDGVMPAAGTGFAIASHEITINRRVDFDMTVDAITPTAKEMISEYDETSDGGLAVSVGLP